MAKLYILADKFLEGKELDEIKGVFSMTRIGQNIIQDDIFTVIENYARTKEMPLEWLRFPIRDPELCACTFIRKRLQ